MRLGFGTCPAFPCCFTGRVAHSNSWNAFLPFHTRTEDSSCKQRLYPFSNLWLTDKRQIVGCPFRWIYAVCAMCWIDWTCGCSGGQVCSDWCPICIPVLSNIDSLKQVSIKGLFILCKLAWLRSLKTWAGRLSLMVIINLKRLMPRTILPLESWKTLGWFPKSQNQLRRLLEHIRLEGNSL